MVTRHYFRGLRPEKREAAAKFKAQRRGGGDISDFFLKGGLPIVCNFLVG